MQVPLLKKSNKTIKDLSPEILLEINFGNKLKMIDL